MGIIVLLTQSFPRRSFAQIDMETMMAMHKMEMSSSVLLTVPMSMESSGTAWQPESSPEYAWMYHTGGWMTMLHGHASPRYTVQGDSPEGFTHAGVTRGGTDFDAPNYIMAMTQHALGSETQIGFRGMFSLDRFTEGGEGYPLMFQTGEAWHGKRLVDIQHPHDIFAELSATLSGRIANDLAGYVYLAYPGEPALGPPAFMHRLSAFTNPDAPISHHWQDATHISFGVATVGLSYAKTLKLEGSLFTGREPDENRFNFDKPRFDSWSIRASWNPLDVLALQVSNGYLVNPEGDNANERLLTASAILTENYGPERWWSSSLVWSDKHDHHTPVAQLSWVLETEVHASGWTPYFRGELVQKPQIELDLFSPPDALEPIGLFTLGLSRRLFAVSGIQLDLGAQGTLYHVPENIQLTYGSDLRSYEVFLSIHPVELHM